MGFSVLVMGIATAFNVLVVLKKVELKRYQDAIFDISILVMLGLALQGSLGGMMVATTASAIVSIYFMFNPPKLFPTIKMPEFAFTKAQKKRIKKRKKAQRERVAKCLL